MAMGSVQGFSSQLQDTVSMFMPEAMVLAQACVVPLALKQIL